MSVSNTMDLDGRNDLGVAERAAAWLSALRQDDNDERRAAFAIWLKESPRHVEEVLFASAVERAMTGFDRDKRIDIAKILEEIPGNVIALQGAPRAAITASLSAVKSRARGFALSFRIAASVAAIVIASAVTAGWSIHSLGADRYATATGEQRAIDLSDGSSIYLNTQSQVRVRYTAQSREVKLVSGEALFKVARDTARPFRVSTADAVVQALGTQFNVYLRPDRQGISGGTSVAVLEGRVRVKPEDHSGAQADLTAGESTRVIANRPIAKHSEPDVARVTAWRARRLVFKADPLEMIAQEFNRYNRSPKIRIEGEEAKKARFTGAFDADDPMSLAQLLDKDRALAVERDEHELVIRPK